MLSKFLSTQDSVYVQPRMGVCCIDEMRHRLLHLKESRFPVIGTLTIDSYTRTRHLKELEDALKKGLPINGFPIHSYPVSAIKEKITALQSRSFFIQLRHGTPQPEKLFEHMVECGLTLTEGGPVSYCLPYGRIPLKTCIKSWETACKNLSQAGEQAHLESFAGCMMGQMGHPALLNALSILEGLFFHQADLEDISLSYAQGYNSTQDLAAVSALKRLANQYFPKNLKWHIVIYTFMGLYPKTHEGHQAILLESLHLATFSKAKRLIVKTHEEATKIPSFESNFEALSFASEKQSSIGSIPLDEDEEEDEIIFTQSQKIIESVLDLGENIGNCLSMAFEKGLLDVSFCLHPDNAKKTSTYIDDKGYIRWSNTGNLNLDSIKKEKKVCSSRLMKDLSYNRNRFDKNL